MSTVFVTGATAGFGLAIARRFAADGHSLILLGRRRQRLEDLSSQLGVPTHLLAQDIRNVTTLAASVEELPGAFRDISILVNNAGLALGLEKAPEAQLPDWDQMIDTNIRALVHLTRAVLPGMIERGSGHIINIGSVAGSYPYPGGNVYGASKAFVEQFSLNLRADLVGTPIRVTNVEPGLAETEFSVVRFKGDRDKAAQVYHGVRALTADDIAEAVHWCSRQPHHVNVNRIELMATAQAFGPFAVARD